MLHHKIYLRAGFIMGVFVLVAGSVTPVVIPQWRPARLLARHWQEELAELPVDQLDQQLRRLNQLDRPGIEVLAASMGHSRRSVRAAGRRVAHESVAEWQRLAPEVAANKLAVLAAEMACQMKNYDKASKQLALEIFQRLLISLPLHDVKQRMKIVRCCEQILLHLRPTTKLTDNRFPRVDFESQFSVMRQFRHAGSNRRFVSGVTRVVDPGQLPVIPGGGIPIVVEELPSPVFP